MAVYMIQSGDDAVKIGFAERPFRRLRDLQTAHPYDLKIIRLLEGGQREEMRLHVRFSHLHIRGEWFQFDASLLGDIGLRDLAIVEPEAEHCPYSTIPSGYIKNVWRQAVHIWKKNSNDGTTPFDIYKDMTQLSIEDTPLFGGIKVEASE